MDVMGSLSLQGHGILCHTTLVVPPTRVMQRDVKWSGTFFATSHGKAEVNWVGVLFKCEVQKEQIKPQGKKLQNVTKIVTHLQEKVNKLYATNRLARGHNKYFHLVKVGDVDGSRPFDCQTMRKS
jgi:hypothetical protein